MKKAINIALGLLIILVTVPVIIKAAPPEAPGPIWDAIDELYEMASGMEGFIAPEEWTAMLYPGTQIINIQPGQEATCNWYSFNVENETEARAITHFDGTPFPAIGTCEGISLEIPGIQLEDIITVEINLSWQGGTEQLPQKELTVIGPPLCVVVDQHENWIYSEWSECIDGEQSRIRTIEFWTTDRYQPDVKCKEWQQQSTEGQSC